MGTFAKANFNSSYERSVICAENYLNAPGNFGLARISHQVSSRGGVGAVLTRRRDRGPRRRTRAVRRAGRPSATQSVRMDTSPQQKAGEKCGLGACAAENVVEFW